MYREVFLNIYFKGLNHFCLCLLLLEVEPFWVFTKKKPQKTNCTLPRKILPSFVDCVTFKYVLHFCPSYQIKIRNCTFLNSFAFETWSLGETEKKWCDAMTAVLAPKENLWKIFRINKDGREILECLTSALRTLL